MQLRSILDANHCNLLCMCIVQVKINGVDKFLKHTKTIDKEGIEGA